MYPTKRPTTSVEKMLHGQLAGAVELLAAFSTGLGSKDVCLSYLQVKENCLAE